jgi:hypothetical protein
MRMVADDLSRLTLQELRQRASSAGMRDADRLSREELITRLTARAPAPTQAPAEEAGLPGLVERARKLVKSAVAEVTQRVTEAAFGGGKAAGASGATTAPVATTTAAATTPSTDDGATETMARLYEEQGHPAQAAEIYRKLLAREPGRTELSEHLRRLEEAARAPAPARPSEPAAPPPQRPTQAHGEPFGILDYEELPDAYGVDEVILMPQDPWYLFAYWEVTPAGRAGARSQLGDEAHAARLVLRLYDVHATDAGVIESQHDVELDWDHGRRYLSAPQSGARASCAVGLRAPSGAFAPIAHSALVRVPPAQPYPEGPVEWMEVLPVRRGGREYEPIVIVTRGRERVVRGASARWEAGAWHHAGSRAPGLAGELLGASHAARTPGESPSADWLRWPSSSRQSPPGRDR